MNDDLFETLLFQTESETLDFKRDQYSFDKERDKDKKGEILKDILAFANANKKEDAYILIGIDEKRNGIDKVVGIKENSHLLNRNLQQFINKKTNRPVEFSYEPYVFKGTHIGVIQIPIQTRPIFINKTFGKVKANVVYLRRSDTTDEAKPDEIARMGEVGNLDSNSRPRFELGFARINRSESLGPDISLVSTLVNTSSIASIPDYGQKGGGYSSFNEVMMPNLSYNHDNEDYYRDKAEYVVYCSIFNNIGLMLTNTSQVFANNVRVRIAVESTKNLFILDDYEMPTSPSKGDYDIKMPNLGINNISPNIRVDKTHEGWTITSDFGDIQPGRTLFSKEDFYIGALEPIDIVLHATIFANNLRKPITFPLKISIKVEQRELSEADYLY